MSAFVVKFCYNQAIKKVQISKDELNWENVCSILMRSFYLSEKDKIQLKYKDLENDEITVSCDEDLGEAFNIYFMKNLVKFFVYYSGVFSDENQSQNTGYSKIPRPKSLTAVPEEIKEKVVEVIQKEHSEKNEKEPEISTAEKINEVKPEVSNIKIDPQELQVIFSEVFSSSEVLKKIQEKLKTYIAKDEKDSSQIVEYSIDTDYQAITNYMMTNLNDIVNQKIQEKPAQEEESKVQSISANKNKEKSFLDVSLRESIYENSTTQGGFSESMKEKDPKVTSFNSSIECRDLGSQLGVKLVLKYENGKAKFVSIPAHEYSIIDRNSGNSSEKYNQSSSLVENKDEIKEEQVDESVGNIVLSLKKKASTTEKKGPEFENRMLKKNLHDLDDDLPAPYDKKVIQKFEKGLQDSVYEKIV